MIQATVSRIFSIFAIPLGAWAAYAGIRDGAIEFSIAVTIGVSLIVWSAWGRGRPQLRAAVALGALLGTGMAVIAGTGWTPNSAIVLAVAAFFALLTLGPSAAVFSVVVATAAYAAAAYAMAEYGWDPIGDRATRLGRMLRLLALYPGLLGGALLAVHYIIRHLERSIVSLNDLSTALRNSEAQFRELFDNVPIGVFRTSADGRILLVNPAYARMLGFETPDEMRGLDARTLYESASDRESAIGAVERDGEVRHLEVRLRRRDGRVITVQCNVRVMRAVGGEVLCYQGTAADISDRRQLEDQLLQARKMEAVGRLAGGVAHDFNNLLTAILGFAQLAREREPGSELQRRDLSNIETAAQSAALLTNQLLAFSRKQVLRPTLTDLNAVVMRGRTLLEREIGADIELVMHLALNLSPIVVDAGQIEHVILNLGVNARDAMPIGGRLTIETYMAVDGRVGLAMADTGVGIDAATLPQIFEPFFTTKERGHGTGLGLATAYGIVQQAGAEIGVHSEPGRGTRFQIHFPSAPVTLQTVVPGPPAEPRKGGAETILLVEDQAEVREIAREILERAGYHVLEAASGPEALALAANCGAEIDLVLSDVIMPSMSGPAFAEKFHSLAANTPIIFMSGYTDHMLDRHGTMATDVPFLAKPFTVDALLTKVRQVLDSS